MKNRVTAIVAMMFLGLLVTIAVPVFRNCHVCGMPVQRIVVLEKSLLVAMLAYEQEFGPLPSDSNADITRRLEGDNPRKIRFLESESGNSNAQGETLDPWGTPLKFYLSANRILVRSAGPNKQFEDGNGGKTDDYVASSETRKPGTARQPAGDDPNVPAR